MDKVTYENLENWVSSKTKGVYNLEITDIPLESLRGNDEKMECSDLAKILSKAKKGVLFNLTLTFPKGTTEVTSCFNGNYKKMPLQSIKIKGDTTSIKDTSWMFYNCDNLTSVDIAPLTDIKDASAMFAGCEKLSQVNLGVLENLTKARSMFMYCKKLDSINFNNFPKVNNTKSMLGGNTLLTTIDCRGINSVGQIFSNS